MIERASNNLLLIVTRAPVTGETKTRLAATIGFDAAAELHRAFLTDLAATMSVGAKRGWFQLGWGYTPGSFDFRGLIAGLEPAAATEHVPFVVQCESDLGSRQSALLRWGHDHGFERTIVMASDSPHVSAERVREAFELLQVYDLVLGRVFDGGYYLLGERGCRDLLSEIPMSTANVADVVLERAASLQLSTVEIAATFDVDIEADLAMLVRDLAPDGDAAPATWRCLRRLGLLNPSSLPVGHDATSTL